MPPWRSRAPAPGVEVPKPASGTCNVYRVQAGDTLYEIAASVGARQLPLSPALGGISCGQPARAAGAAVHLSPKTPVQLQLHRVGGRLSNRSHCPTRKAVQLLLYSRLAAALPLPRPRSSCVTVSRVCSRPLPPALQFGTTTVELVAINANLAAGGVLSTDTEVFIPPL